MVLMGARRPTGTVALTAKLMTFTANAAPNATRVAIRAATGDADLRR